MKSQPQLGAQVRGTRTQFALYSDTAQRCAVRLYDPAGVPLGTHPLTALGDGYFSRELEGVGHGALYKFLLDDREFPDPYARFLPQGVHGVARVTVPQYQFRNPPPKPRSLSEQVLYELHVGTFTPEGTYAAASKRLPHLAELGVTTLELMPLSAFPGECGWGYDGVAHYAPHAAYGEPDDLREFIDRAHGLGLTVLLDVVYNHFGPSGNYLGAYSARYFTDQFQNAWGAAPRFNEAPMRRYLLDNALYWIQEFKFDGFRLDATHAIFDPSGVHVLRELAERVHQAAPHALLIAEDERNEPGCVTAWGVDAIWADDFHHQVRVTFTQERDGYYAGYAPGTEALARTIEGGWLYQGQPFPPENKARGKNAEHLPAHAFVYAIQNHDQIGNRAFGTRLTADAGLDAHALASALLLFLPMTPLLFMGQEWAAATPFLYFTAHDPELGALVTAGRRREFARFEAFSDPALREKIPDPQSRDTFERSKLDWSELDREPHSRILSIYRELLALRREDPLFKRTRERAQLSVRADGAWLAVRRQDPTTNQARLLLANFGDRPLSIDSAPWASGSESIVFRLGEGGRGQVAGRGAVILATG